MDLQNMLSDRTVSLKPSGIRRFFDIANEMEGVIALGVGEPDFKTPYSVRQAAIQNLQHGQTRYTANAGLSELRRAISDYLKRKFDLAYDKKDEILVTVGGSEAIDLAIRAFLNPGDEVLIPEPCFVCYSPIVTLTSGVPVSIQTREEDEFRLTPEQLEAAITPKTKMLVLPYPNNPTGAIMTKNDLEPIAAALADTNIAILTDEIYSELTYGRSHYSIISLPGMKERTVYVNGFSKAFSMTGWRLGYMCGPKEIIKHALKIHQYGIMSSPTVSQYAAIEALTSCEEDVKSMVSEYDTRRKYLVNSFNGMGLDCFTPEGAFYVFPSIASTGLSSEEFCEKLLYSKRVAVIPGTAFGDCGEGYIRVSYAYSLKHLTEAVKRIREFLSELEHE